MTIYMEPITITATTLTSIIMDPTIIQASVALASIPATLLMVAIPLLITMGLVVVTLALNDEPEFKFEHLAIENIECDLAHSQYQAWSSAWSRDPKVHAIVEEWLEVKA